MNKLLKTCVFMAALLAPAGAMAANGFTTGNVNLRSGPGTGYPVVDTVPAGSPLNIRGCLNDIPWCDVSYGGLRGWMSHNYIQITYNNRRTGLTPGLYAALSIPLITFNLDRYWGRHYRTRPFYNNRTYWNNRFGAPRPGVRPPAAPGKPAAPAVPGKPRPPAAGAGPQRPVTLPGRPPRPAFAGPGRRP
ncbi:MAG: SH3 domain-containing protein [Methylobacteriaceae bacterium]|jgi:uncharacterized protein YraI|nr:SH3 domain-containing protein [Methylobacteriaceae bacterium]